MNKENNDPKAAFLNKLNSFLVRENAQMRMAYRFPDNDELGTKRVIEVTVNHRSGKADVFDLEEI